MLKSKCAAVFTKNNARMIWYDAIEDLKDFHNVIVSVDLAHVSGVPPHFWKLQDGVIREMSPEEKDRRIHDINTEGLEVDPKNSQIAAYETRVAKELREEKEREQAYEANLQSKFDSLHKDIDALSKSHSSTTAEHKTNLDNTFKYLSNRIDSQVKLTRFDFDGQANEIRNTHNDRMLACEELLASHMMKTDGAFSDLSKIIEKYKNSALFIQTAQLIFLIVLAYKVFH